MYQISSYAVPNLILAIFCLAMGLFVFLKNRNSAANIAFLILASSAAVWQLGTFLVALSTRPDLALLWSRFAYIGVIFIPIAIYHLIVSFVRSEKQKKFVLLCYAIGGLVFIPLNATKYLISGVYKYFWGYWFKAGALHPLFAVFFATLLLASISNLFIDYRREEVATERARKRFLLTAFFILYMGSVDFIPDYGIAVYPFGYLPVIIFIGMVSYAIVKHRLMDVPLLVSRSLAYIFLLFAVGGFFVFTVSYLKQLYQGFMSQNTAFVIAGLIAVFGFQLLRAFLQKATDKIFAKGRYNFEELLEKLGKLMSTRVVLGDLATSMLQTLVTEMRLTRAAFVIVKGPRVTEVEAIGYKSKSVSFWDKATKLVADKKGTIIADELAEDSKEKEILRRLNAEVLLPLVAEEDVVGILALGEKRSGDMFTAQDIRCLEIIAPEAAIAVNNASLFKEKEKRIEELNSLNKLALSLGSTLHLDELLEELIDEAIRVTGAETGSIMLLDEETQTLRMKAARGIPPEVYRRAKAKVGEGIAGWVAKTSEPTMIIDSQHENEYLGKCLKREEITSALSVPLKIRNKVIGVLSVNRKKKKEVFTEEALNLMTSYAAQAAEAIENARLFEKSERQFMETITTLSGAVEAKDPYTRGHSDAVTKYAVSIAKEMGLPSEEIRNIEIAGRLHDIGKIGIPEAILNKPGRLSKEEREIINQHPRISVDILKAAGSLKDIIPTILYHHERFDGKGYPTGLAGKAIPLGARILAVADSFNAMTTDRPYRLALSLEGTIRELKENAGAQFDPDVVEAMLKVLETSELKPEVKVDHRTRHVKPLTAVS